MDKPIASSDPWDEFRIKVQSELDQSRREFKEVSQMLEQSQTEMNKLTKRSATITTQLQLVQAQIETIPRAEIRIAYNSALDAQQRLLVMRSQINKLQTDQNYHQRFISYLESVLKFLTEGQIQSRSAREYRGGSTTLEKLVNAQEAERKRLTRQMHDGPAQVLSNFIVQAEIAARLFDIDPVRAKEELENLQSAAMATFQNIRMFITGLRPMMLDDLGLAPTLKRYVDSFKEETGIDTKMNFKGSDRRLVPYLEVVIFRAVQELISNVVHHNTDAPSKLQINVQVSIDDNPVRVLVQDNGKGFNPDDIQNEKGLSLKLIRERVEMVGGEMEIQSSPGQGTRIAFQIPVDGAIVS